MRIAYIAVGLDLDERRGVLEKVGGQMRQWRAAGCDTRLFIQGHRVPPSDDAAARLLDGNVEVFLDDRIEGRSFFLGLRRRFEVVHSLVRRVLEWGPDLVYFRFNTSYPALARLAERRPMILELNTDDLREYRLNLSSPRYVYHRLARTSLLSRARGFVFAHGGIAKAPSYSRWRKPLAVIANGIDLSAYSAHPVVPNARTRLVFMGSPGHAWHGLDKVLLLARSCPDWDFDIIGPTAPEKPHAAPSNARFHGYLRRDEYDPILSKADIGLGTFALHRKGMNEDATLKVREYLAYGIPTIIGHRDTDFLNGTRYLLELPNTEDNIASNAGTIREFVSQMMGVRVPRSAIAHLDVARKEARRLAFFEQLCRHGRAEAVLRQ